MFYQPKVRLLDGRVAGAEALIRWEHPSLGLVPPDEFIPLVEKTVLLRPLTYYVAESVLKQWRAWADSASGCRCPINMSPRSLLDQELPRPDRGPAGADWDVPPAFLRIELTEGFLLGDSGRSISVLDGLAGVGVGPVDRRLRHRLLVVVLPQAPADRGDQGRPVVRDADAGRRERLHDRARDRRPRPQPRPAGRCGGRRGPRHVRPARRVRLRRSPGLLHLEAPYPRSSSRGGFPCGTSSCAAGYRARSVRPQLPFGPIWTPQISSPQRRILSSAPSRATGAFAAVRKGFGCRSASLVEAFAGSEPFEAACCWRASARSRPVWMRARGSSLRRSRPRSTPPCSRSPPGPREAESLLADVAAFLPDGALLLPAWEALPYELHLAGARGRGAPRQRRFAGCARQPVPSSSWRRSSRRCRRSRRLRAPSPPLVLARGTSIAARRARRRHSRSGLCARRRGGASRRVRGHEAGSSTSSPADERRPVRLEYWGDEVESIRRFVPSTQLSTRTGRAGVRSTRSRELVLDDATRDRARTAAAALDDGRLRRPPGEDRRRDSRRRAWRPRRRSSSTG